MPPNSNEKVPDELMEDAKEDFMENSSENLKKLVAPQADPNFKYEISHPKVFFMLCFMLLYFHLESIWALTMINSINWATLAFLLVNHSICMLGVTMGVHRYWSHRSFKANLPLQILMMIAFSSSYQRAILWWARTHRQHHKYSDTDADPHNSTRGLFYSHIGWFLLKPHPEVYRRRKEIDISDLKNDPVVMFQKKYFTIVSVVTVFILPILILMSLGNTFGTAVHWNNLRIVAGFHCTFLINSYAHAVGARPYDKSVVGVQNLPVSFFAVGEGFHNYHHTFPSDYRAAEFGNNKLNLTTLVINAFAYIGWAYDLRTVAQRAIDARAARTGDGSDLWGRTQRVGTEMPSGVKL